MGAATLDSPVWYEPLRQPSWFVPPVRDDAPRVLFSAQAWDEDSVDEAGRDLRLGLPLFLAEALRFGTNARPSSATRDVEDDLSQSSGRATIRTAVAPPGGPSIRVQVFDPHGSLLGEVARDAHDQASLGLALDGVPHAVAQAVAPLGIRPVWNSLYRLPTGSALVTYVRGQRACLRMGTPTPTPARPAPEEVSERRESDRAVLTTLGALATSTAEPFPALLFFGALLTAFDAESSVFGEFRLQANARCTAATDPLDPVFAMTALVLRIFGDRDSSERRMDALGTSGDAALQRWLARVRTVT